MAKSSTEKYKLSMVGEYGVCAALSKRGFGANITLGNAKMTVVIIFPKNKSLRRIEVQDSLFQKNYEEE